MDKETKRYSVLHCQYNDKPTTLSPKNGQTLKRYSSKL